MLLSGRPAWPKWRLSSQFASLSQHSSRSANTRWEKGSDWRKSTTSGDAKYLHPMRTAGWSHADKRLPAFLCSPYIKASVWQSEECAPLTTKGMPRSHLYALLHWRCSFYSDGSKVQMYDHPMIHVYYAQSTGGCRCEIVHVKMAFDC